jgi:hypothetical protein
MNGTVSGYELGGVVKGLSPCTEAQIWAAPGVQRSRLFKVLCALREERLSRNGKLAAFRLDALR